MKDNVKDKWWGCGPQGEFFRADPLHQAMKMKRKKDLERLLTWSQECPPPVKTQPGGESDVEPGGVA